MNKAIFLDRDGVINKEVNYLYKIEDCEFVDGIFEICKYFQDQGYLLIVVTNQAGIARGYYTENDFKKLTDWMVREFKRRLIDIIDVFHCPHHIDGVVEGYAINCNCRKPKPGMLYEAKKKFDIDMDSSILIGDKMSDIEAARNSGVGMSVLIKTNDYCEGDDFELADVVVKNFNELRKYL